MKFLVGLHTVDLSWAEHRQDDVVFYFLLEANSWLHTSGVKEWVLGGIWPTGHLTWDVMKVQSPLYLSNRDRSGHSVCQGSHTVWLWPRITLTCFVKKTNNLTKMEEVSVRLSFNFLDNRSSDRLHTWCVYSWGPEASSWDLQDIVISSMLCTHCVVYWEGTLSNGMLGTACFILIATVHPRTDEDGETGDVTLW